jgi:hypothetical protein
MPYGTRVVFGEQIAQQSQKSATKQDAGNSTDKPPYDSFDWSQGRRVPAKP